MSAPAIARGDAVVIPDGRRGFVRSVAATVPADAQRPVTYTAIVTLFDGSGAKEVPGALLKRSARGRA